MRAATALLGLAFAACGSSGETPHHHDARATPDAGARANGLPLVGDLCRSGDGDLVATAPTVVRAPMCNGDGPDAPGPLFSDDVGELPAAYTDLHALCARLDPTASTHDAETDAQLTAAVHAYLVARVADPPLARALAALPADPEARADALAALWLPGNAFEHVLCGELNGNGTVGGLHQWSELYLAEREGRVDYVCTRAGVGDAAIAAIQFRWRPQGRTAFALKPFGSMQLGASPACLLALGYTAVAAGAGAPMGAGDTASFVADTYGARRDWVLGLTDTGAIGTLYPHARP